MIHWVKLKKKEDLTNVEVTQGGSEKERDMVDGLMQLGISRLEDIHKVKIS
jgi:hypothetical protein